MIECSKCGESVRFVYGDGRCEGCARLIPYEFDDAEALRLVQRTELNRAFVEYEKTAGPDQTPELLRCVNVRDYGGGIVEIGYSSVQMVPPAERVKDETEKDVPEHIKRQINLARSVRRSKAQVRRKCMAGGLDHLLTLTYRQNVTSLDSAFYDAKRFIRLVRKRLPEWKYVLVPEFQKRGAVHFHMAVRGFQDVRLLRRCWLEVVGAGNIDVQGPRFSGSVKWKLPKLASYLSKYITKDQSAANARQRYRVAEGIEIPSAITVHRFPRFTDFVAEFFDSLGVPMSHHWKGEAGQYGWACSW